MYMIVKYFLLNLYLEVIAKPPVKQGRLLHMRHVPSSVASPTGYRYDLQYYAPFLQFRNALSGLP